MIYLIRMQGTNYVKIGIAREPKKRLASLASGNPMPLELLFSIATTEDGGFLGSVQDGQAEIEIHTELEPLRVRGEWFELTQSRVDSVIKELTERFRTRVYWNQWRQAYPPEGYVKGEEYYTRRPLLSHALA